MAHALVLFGPPARGLQHRVLVKFLAVLASDLEIGAKGVAAEGGVVLQQALTTAVESEGEAGYGSVGDGLEGGADTGDPFAVDLFRDGVDLAVEVDVDLAV